MIPLLKVLATRHNEQIFISAAAMDCFLDVISRKRQLVAFSFAYTDSPLNDEPWWRGSACLREYGERNYGGVIVLAGNTVGLVPVNKLINTRKRLRN